MKKQNIEDIFSSLESYSTPPPPDLWAGIEAQLDEPKKKKRAIIWWPLAACLVLGLSLGSMLYFSESPIIIPNDIPTSTGKKVVIEEVSKTVNTEEAQHYKEDNRQIIKPKTTNPTVISSQNTFNQNTKNQQVNANSALKNGNNKAFATTFYSKKENTISESNTDLSSFVRNKSNKEQTVTSNHNGSNRNTLAETNQTKSNTFDSITQTKIDQELQVLENALAKIEDPKKENTKILEDRWSVGIYAGVASSENFNNKKVLGAAVASQQTTGFGVKTNYKLNKKWGVSSGLKINKLGQSVDNVSYYNKQASYSSDLTTNVAITANQNVSYLSNNKDYVFSTDNSSNIQKTNNVSTASIDQRLQYLELPLEVSYAVLSTKKAAIRFNTGGFVGKLISNEILLDGSSIGENINVNDFVYGSQLSSTLQYEVLKKTNVFVEPGINYYLNPVQNESFNQFQWALNFGVNFKF